MDNIILIGMPGAGKSTVGVVLAKYLGYSFLDSDLAICEKTGSTLQSLLDRLGQREFLNIEADVVCGLSPRKTVVATGGSVPMSDRAMSHLKALGHVVYLQVPLEELKRRISNPETRGIAFDPGQSLDALYARRIPVYARWADVTVPTDMARNTIESMAEKILEQLPRERAPGSPG